MNVQEKILVLMLAWIQFTHVTDFMVLMPLGPTLMADLGIDIDAFGFLVAYYTFGAAFGVGVSTLIVDRFSRKQVLLVAYIGFCIGILGCVLADSYLALSIFRMINGAFGGVCGAMVFTVAADVFAYERRGQAMSYIVMAFSVASVVGVPLGAYLGMHFGWQMAFVFIGGVCCLALCAMLLFFPTVLFQNQSVSSPTKESKSLLNIQAFTRAFTIPVRFWALLFSFLLMLGHFAIGPFISKYLSGNLGYNDNTIIWVYFFIGVATSIASPLIGWLSDSIGKKQVFVWGNGLVAAIMFLVGFFLNGSIFWVVLLTACLYVFLTARAIPSITIVSAVVPPDELASFMNIRAVMNQLAAGFAPLAGAAFIVQNPDGSLSGFEYIGAFAAITALLVFLPFFKMQQNRGGGM